MKIYEKDGYSKRVKFGYCKEHFIARFNREPNISDKATFGECKDCKDSTRIRHD